MILGGLSYRCRDHSNKVLQWGRQIEFNSDYNEEKREFVTKELSRD
jgi:hypothetical protein